MRFYISHFTLTGERIPELIEPEVINVTAHKRERKPKAAYEEMFDNLPHSYVSAGLAPHAMYGKFINALPYYRQEKDFKNPFGVKIGRGAMVHQTIYCAENYFSSMIIEGSGQASAVKVLCVMFRSRGDGLNPIIVYQYPPARNGDAAAKFIQESLPGTYINVDGYADYNKLKDFKRCCCYAHYPRSIVIPEEMQISA